MVFSTLFRFFAPKQQDQDSSVRPATSTELEEIIETVCKGFNYQRSQLESFQSTFQDHLKQHNASQPSQTDIDYLKSEIYANSSSIADISSHLSTLDNSIMTEASIRSFIRTEIDSMKSHIFEEIKLNNADLESKIYQKTQIPATNQHQPTTQPSQHHNIHIENLTSLEKKILQTIVRLKVNQGLNSISISELVKILYPDGNPLTKRPTVSAYISKLEAAGFITKNRIGSIVQISLIGDRVINYFLSENYTKLKKAL